MKRSVKARFKVWWEDKENAETNLFRYRRLWLVGLLSTLLVSLAPLVIMFAINYRQYQKAFEEEVKHPIRLCASNMRRTLEFFLEERRSVLRYIVHDQSLVSLEDQKNLSRIFRLVRENYPGFVDLGVIDHQGVQRSYVGPYGLKGKNYRDQSWFKETLFRGVYISDVFLGYRHLPHFVIAVKNETEDGNAYLLRATMNAEVLAKLSTLNDTGACRDTFIINHEGVLQTTSTSFGKVLTRVPISIPPASNQTRITEEPDGKGGIRIMGFSHIKESPFIYMVLETRAALLGSWFALRNKLFWFLGGSVVLIILVVLTGTTYMINNVREADMRRVALLHNVEYTNKMASIGRLAAGVAHEINNPLAIINEKAGLLKDYINFTPDFKDKERFLKHVEPILGSVERCSRITRRLLRFAKHLDLRMEGINLEGLIREVVGFLEKECSYRNIEIQIRSDPDVPVIESDRGRLQQVFLNIINNAVAAVADGGKIEVSVAVEDERFVRVCVLDNGQGIPPENLPYIFEPFFTTKEKHGTGLGLSITYGIVEKLGGRITVDSKVSEWTRFSVSLPIKPVKTGGPNEGASGAAG